MSWDQGTQRDRGLGTVERAETKDGDGRWRNETLDRDPARGVVKCDQPTPFLTASFPKIQAPRGCPAPG